MSNRRLLLFSIFIISTCFLSIIIFTNQNIIKVVFPKLDENAAIGSTLSGITAPIIGLITCIFLLLSFNKQVESNNIQREKNEIDILQVMIHSVDSELERFNTSFSKKDQQYKLTGIDGLTEWCRLYRFEYDVNQFAKDPRFTLSAWKETGQIILIIDSLDLIYRRLQTSSISSEMRAILESKLQSFYVSLLLMPLNNLVEALKNYPEQIDNNAKKIIHFVEKWNIIAPQSQSIIAKWNQAVKIGLF